MPAVTLLDHTITVPLVHDAPDGRELTVYAREVRAKDHTDATPALLFLQGGPGGESPRPDDRGTDPVWLPRLLEDYRVIFLDQRGTGLSSPIGARPADRSAAELAEELTHYRADSIVRDAELLREHLGIEQWTLLGQSFGGFCTLHYLSRFPGSVAEALFTGGVPPVGLPVDEVYAGTYQRQLMLTQRHYRRFPGDRDRMRALVAACDAGEIRLPTGDLLSSRQLRGLGSKLGMSGGSQALHYLLERDPASPGFRYGVMDALPFSGSSPLYILVHEACYADGGATRWACERVLPAAYGEDPTLLTSEHPFPWNLDECAELAPWREAADLLAEHEWPRLYDEDALRDCHVPCAAAIYVDDPYVLEEHSRATAELLPGMRPWITNEYLHNGIRAGGTAVVDRLIDLVKRPA